jgi:hypothetical protein
MESVYLVLAMALAVVASGYPVCVPPFAMPLPKRFALSPASSGAVQIEGCDRGWLL